MRLFVWCIAFSACATAAPTVPDASQNPKGISVSLGEEFQLLNNQVATIGREGLRLHFDQVSVDGRCSVGSTCSDEGDALVEIVAAQPPNESASMTLHTRPSLPTAEIYRGYRIKLVRLEPMPVGEQPVPLQKYTATIVVSVRD